jgi:hypothetical protein
VILWERSASRRRMVSRVKGSWAGRESDGVSDVEEGTGSGGGGTSRPATNITGASCTNNSGGYEFMLRSSSSEEILSRTLEQPSFKYFEFLTQFSLNCHKTWCTYLPFCILPCCCPVPQWVNWRSGHTVTTRDKIDCVTQGATATKASPDFPPYVIVPEPYRPISHIYFH